MDARTVLTERMTRAAQQLRRELEAAGLLDGVLPADEITVYETADGVNIRFLRDEQAVSAAASKRARKAQIDAETL